LRHENKKKGVQMPINFYVLIWLKKAIPLQPEKLAEFFMNYRALFRVIIVQIFDIQALTKTAIRNHLPLQ